MWWSEQRAVSPPIWNLLKMSISQQLNHLVLTAADNNSVIQEEEEKQVNEDLGYKLFKMNLELSAHPLLSLLMREPSSFVIITIILCVSLFSTAFLVQLSRVCVIRECVQPTA